jgi:anaerobic magnesium-protoporphyrin IX monomethyl ester cyclase
LEEAKMKLCLISPPAPFATEPAMNPPLSLCYISACAKEQVKGIEIIGIDYALHKEYDYNTLAYTRELPIDCEIYGITAFSAQFRWLREIIEFLKTANPTCKVVVGGPHASACPEEVISLGADHVVVGLGEQFFDDLINGYDVPQPLEPINEYRSICLDKLPIPDRELFGLANYKRTINGEQAVHIITLRGCPYSCRFCHKSSVGSQIRYRSIEKVLEEVDYLMSTYGTKGFVIYDDCFTLLNGRVDRFCEEFKKRGIFWRCWSRTNLVTEDMLALMKDSGLSSITFGVESGDDKILQVINKKTTVAHNRAALLACKKIGLPVRCSLMYGNPYENRESVDNTIKLMEECQPDEWNLAVLAPVPGSEFWDRPELYGLKFDKEWVKSQDYLVTNRFQESGVGSLWIEHVGTPKEVLQANLQYMIGTLERVCLRKKIQDTIQTIDRSKL